MMAYAAWRVVGMVPVLLGIATVTFVLMHFVPGGPWDEGKRLPPQVVENLNQRYGLDDPLWRQYISFLGNAARGDLGASYIYQGRDVTKIIGQALPPTVILGVTAFLIAVATGLPLGILAATHRGSAVDILSVGFSSVFASVPGFVTAMLPVILFSVRWHVLPSGGWGAPAHVVMPALALAVLPMALITRVTRASILEALSQDYVQTARSKGLPNWAVYQRHVLKNAAIPILTILGPELAALITGSFIIESVFSIPGAGRLFVQGVLQRDYGLIMGMVLLYSVAITLANLVVDVLYAAVDPRIRDE